MKDINSWGVLLKEEASYNAGATLAAADDGLLVQEEPLVTPAYVYDGQRRNNGRGPMNVGQPRVGKSARSGDVPIVHEGHGAGAAYAAAVTPSFHLLARLAGLAATLDSSSGSESYTYALGTGISGAGEFYTRSEIRALQGLYAVDLTISAQGPEPPVWEVPLRGLMPSLPDDSAVPSITYPDVEPPIAENLQLALGSFATAIVREFTFKLNREDPSARVDQNAAAGHGGFAMGGCRPTLEVLIEADSLVGTPFHSASGIDPYSLEELATAIAISLQIGGTQYNQYSISADQAQLISAPDDLDNVTGLWRLTWELNPSAPGLKDNFSIVAD